MLIILHIYVAHQRLVHDEMHAQSLWWCNNCIIIRQNVGHVCIVHSFNFRKTGAHTQ